MRQDGRMTAWAAPRAHAPAARDASSCPVRSRSPTGVLVLAALADGPSRIVAPLRARDTLLMAGGAARARRRDRRRRRRLARHARTAARRHASTPASPARSCGSCRRSPRSPTAPVIVRRRPLRPRAADGHPDRRAAAGRRRASTTAGAAGCRSPCTARGAVDGGAVHIDASASSQFVSGLLLAGARYEQGHRGRAHRRPRRCRRSRISTMTVDVLRAAGVAVARPAPGRVARRARPDRGARLGRSSPTCPTPRRSSPRRWPPAARSRCRGWPARDDPGRRRAARPAARDGRRGRRCDDGGADGARPGPSCSGSTPTCTTSAS